MDIHVHVHVHTCTCMSRWLYTRLDSFKNGLPVFNIHACCTCACTYSIILFLSHITWVIVTIALKLLQYLLDICSCVSLARSLITYCCPKLSSLHELNQRLQKTHVLPALPAPSAPIPTPTVEIKVEPQPHTLGQEEDSVFNDHPATKQDPDQKASCSHERERKLVSSVGAGKDIGANGAVQRGSDKEKTAERGEGRYFSWCNHHNSLLLQLSCIVQTVAVQCPTAFVHSRVKSVGKDAGECVRRKRLF